MSSEAASRTALFVVATPIGNLEDITARALRVLAEADLIAAEDTRHTAKLLQHFGIHKPLESCHEHNERDKAQGLLARMQAGATVALVTDAGTPAISDPGYWLVRLAHEAGLRVEPIPGPCAVTALLSAAGLPTDRFTFHGFFPRKASQAATLLEACRSLPGTHVFYESPNRLVRTLSIFQEHEPEALMALGRELTKLHETILRGQAGELLAAVERGPIRGECVLALYLAEAEAPSLGDEQLLALVQGAMDEHNLSRRDAVAWVARQHGIPKNRVYRAAGAGA